MKKDNNILIIGPVFPEPNSSAASSRMMQLIELFQSQNCSEGAPKWKITFASAASDSDFMIDLVTIGIDKVTIELNNSSFDEFVKKLNPDIVLFDRFMIEEQFGWRVAENCPNALRILDTIDLHCLRLARQKAFKENRKFNSSDLYEDVAKREIASILRCDQSLIISEVEMDILQNVFKIDTSLLHYIPFLLNSIDESQTKNWPSFESRTHFISIGNFLHEPNWNAVLFLKEEIWPLIRKALPQAEIHIYGAYPSQKVNELHKSEDGFLIMGRAKNAAEVVSKARVCLAPLRFGAGIKGKLVEAMQCGTASVTTDIGAESMHGNLEWCGSVANNAHDFATEAIKLYNNKEAWQKAQNNGITIINICYSKHRLGTKLIKKMLNLQNNLESHRLNNFTGAMLMHHTLTSTKYMSKWIEAKNKTPI